MILSIFFIENIELDLIGMTGIEFLQERSIIRGKESEKSTKLYDFIFVPNRKKMINNHELLIDGEYFDIISEHTIDNVHHYYCKADKIEGILMNFIGWVKSKKENQDPWNASGFLKSKLKSVKYINGQTVLLTSYVLLNPSLSNFKVNNYFPPFLPISIPPPMA